MASSQIVRYNRHEFDLRETDQVKALTNSLRTSLKFPEKLDQFIESSAAERDRMKWQMARALVKYLDAFPKNLRSIVRPLIVEHYAPIMRNEETTVREMLHTAEVIPIGLEQDDRLSMLGFSHWTRLARVGDVKLIKQMLDQIVREASEATRITCEYIDRLNISNKLQSEGFGKPEINALLPTLAPAQPSHSRIQGQVEVYQNGQGPRKVIWLPVDDLQFAEGDQVIVIRRKVSEE